MKQSRKDAIDQLGQSALEFAIVVPVLLVLVLGTLDIGRGLYAYIALENAVRDGARYGTIYTSPPPTGGSITTKVLDAAAGPTLSRNDISVSVCKYFFSSPGSCQPYDGLPIPGMLKVTATNQFKPLLPFIPSFGIYAEATNAFE